MNIDTMIEANRNNISQIAFPAINTRAGLVNDNGNQNCFLNVCVQGLSVLYCCNLPMI